MTTVSYSRSIITEHKARLERFAAEVFELRSGLEELAEDMKQKGAAHTEDEEEILRPRRGVD